MRFWPRSATETIREAFAFLTNDCGYRLVSESGLGMGVTVTYRSPALWVAVNADRGDAWVEVTPARSADDPYDDRLLAELLAGHEQYIADCSPAELRGVSECAAFLRANLAELERRFSPERRDETRRRLATLRASRAKRAKG
jgi:hypothetical protein